MISNCQLKRNKDFKGRGKGRRREGGSQRGGEGKDWKKIGNFSVQLSTIKKANFSRTLLSDSAHALPPHIFKGACTDICRGRWVPWLKFLTNTDISLVCVCGGGGIIPFQSIFKYQRATVSPYRDDEHSAKDAASLLCFVSLFVVFFFMAGAGTGLVWGALGTCARGMFLPRGRSENCRL